MLHNSVLSEQLKKRKKKKKKKTQRSATISKVAGRNCTKSNTPHTSPKLHKRHQITQLITYSYILRPCSFG